MSNTGEIILYQAADGTSKIEVTLQNETVWLTLDQMAELFQRNKSTISRHVKTFLNAESLTKVQPLRFLQQFKMKVEGRWKDRLLSTISI